MRPLCYCLVPDLPDLPFAHIDKVRIDLLGGLRPDQALAVGSGFHLDLELVAGHDAPRDVGHEGLLDVLGFRSGKEYAQRTLLLEVLHHLLVLLVTHSVELSVARGLGLELGFRGIEFKPGPNVQSDVELIEWIGKTAETAYHPVGTCRMGSDERAVVNDQLRVHGLEGLRIADGSIMPTLVSGNTNAACIMIGEKAASIILAEHGKLFRIGTPYDNNYMKLCSMH